ncbi:trypsin [Nitzschia inconspicua]|uniref:Trypsin n=1 Tax=Nitzschia inconspicua TaxID=303405 RepID=A0A9K3PYZ1_9STRA|nr:trypsin [Nitzschia inconspicua]
MRFPTPAALLFATVSSFVSAAAGKAVEAEISSSAGVTTDTGNNGRFKHRTLSEAFKSRAGKNLGQNVKEAPAEPKTTFKARQLNVTGDEPEFLIVDGFQVPNRDMYPFFVALLGPSDVQATCGGSLIAPNVVLTAASCADGFSYVGEPVVVGAYNLDDPFNAIVLEQIIQPQFRVGSPAEDVVKNDLMLLLLDTEFELDEEDYMRLSNYEEDMEPGVEATIIGFGNTAQDGIAIPDTLQQGNQPIWFDGDCEIVWGAQTTPSNVDGDIELCGGGRTFQEASAFGDIGGPLFVQVDDLNYQIGVFSWGPVDETAPGIPSVYAQIPLNENGFDWIRQTVCGEWEVEALFCIECESDCECPETYECICYEEIESRRRLNKRNEIENKLMHLNEGFLSPDNGKEEATYDINSQQKAGENKATENSSGHRRNKRGARKLQSPTDGKGKGSKGCKSSSTVKRCDSGEAGYCFRSDTSLVDDFAGGKKS